MSILRPFIVIPTIFFLVSFILMGNYGISWDEPIHFYRGQAYLHFFLTGEKNFSSLPKIAEHTRAREGVDYLKQGYVSVKDFRRSYFQDNTLTTEYFLIHDAGHPPLNGILSALTNYIFYQKLGILGDIQAHHLFNLLASTFLVFVVCIFAYQKYGSFASVISGLVICLYPIFFAESQFNIKDPPQAAFFAATIWSFWHSLKKGNWKWLLASVIFAAVSFGIKFNILFLPFIIIPYLVARFVPGLKRKDLNKKINKIPKNYIKVLISAPFLIIFIFVAVWPFLWSDPLNNFSSILKYYKEIGSGTEVQHAFLGFWKLNLYPALWILITTPPIVLLFSSLGIYMAFKKWKEKDKTAVLWLLWFFIPITRVTIPGSSIYGGIRQIFEYIPAMALLSGLAAHDLALRLKSSFIIKSVTVFTLGLILVIPVIKYHPNQNVYFNFLVGGLSGARESNIPYWGNSFGNAYYQALNWLNLNAEENAKLGLVQGTGLNIPQVHLRADIQYWNNYWSGIMREGEYLLELTHDDPVKVYPYAWEYVQKFLEPVYEVKVDGVTIATLWKNDFDHTKPEYQKNELIQIKELKVKIENNLMTVELPQEQSLTRLRVDFIKNQTCDSVNGYISTSTDGTNWINEADSVPSLQISNDISVNDKQMNHFFAGRRARYIRFLASSQESCVFQKPNISVYSMQ